MIDTALYVQFGSTLPFQQSGMPMPDLPAATTDILTWDDDQRLLVVATGTPLGAVAFRVEVTDSKPPLEKQGWDEWQEISVRFDIDDVRLRDLDADKKLLDASLVDEPGRYRPSGDDTDRPNHYTRNEARCASGRDRRVTSA
nr:hypothetical protein [Rhodococcus wratislaviensis]GLK39511.1 hypothetical protein GCM10017611_63820 [Rhodococcus wratislaviensis]